MMAETGLHEIDLLLEAWGRGDSAALDTLVPLIEAELHAIAHRQFRRESNLQTLQTTAVVNEVYLRLRELQKGPDNRAKFYTTLVKMTRWVLVDQARQRRAEKRGAGVTKIPIDMEGLQVPDDQQLVALDDALKDLARLHHRQAAVVELRIFGGYTLEEIGAQLGVAINTVSRDWNTARAWLHRELSTPDEGRPASSREKIAGPPKSNRVGHE